MNYKKGINGAEHFEIGVTRGKLSSVMCKTNEGQIISCLKQNLIECREIKYTTFSYTSPGLRLWSVQVPT